MNESCPYFIHIKQGNIHEHRCARPINITQRCGYKLHDWIKCPIRKFDCNKFIDELCRLNNQLLEIHGMLEDMGDPDAQIMFIMQQVVSRMLSEY